MMKPSYVDELGLLAASFTWAAREDISPIAELLDIVVSGTALYIGSGGALAVSALASALHVAKTGRLATHGTPLAVSGGPLRHSTAAVLFSARAGHPDVALAARAAVRQGCDPVGLVTHRRIDEIPSSLASQPITIVSYAAPFTRDGFLATNTVLTMSTLLVRWYARGSFLLPDQLRPQISGDGRSMTQNCLVLVGSGTEAAGIDLETRLSETGLAAAQLVDYRNFAHGRHYGLSRNQDRTTIVAFIAPEYADLANATLAQLPNEVPVIRIETAQAWPCGVLELLVGSMQLIGQVSDAARLDPARPHVPEFGRALYHLNSQSKISMVAHDPVARKLIALGAPASNTIRDRRASERLWREIPRRLPNGHDVQKLLAAIVRMAVQETHRPTAPYAPGVTETALSMTDRAQLLQPAVREKIRGADALFWALASALANNILSAELDRSVKHGSFMVLYLNRLLCPRFGLPLNYGGFREKKLREMASWMVEPEFDPPPHEPDKELELPLWTA